MYHVSALFWRLFLFPFRVKKVKGRENIPKKGPYILIANHVSVFDPWDVVGAYGWFRAPIHWVAALFLFSAERSGEAFFTSLPYMLRTFFGRCVVFVVKNSATIPIEREIDGRGEVSSVNRKALRSIKKILENGGVVGIFPEGGVNKGEIYHGFIKIASKNNVPIVRVKIDGCKIEFFPPIGLEIEKGEKRNISYVAQKILE